MKPCVICEVDRAEDTLDDRGVCPFCMDKPLPLPPEPPEPPPPPQNYLTTPAPKKKPVYKHIEKEEPRQLEESVPYTPPTYTPSSSPEQELANRELARRRLLPFIQRFRPKYMPGWAHEDICRRLERFMKDVEEKKSPRLLIMLPPRFGKSEIGSRHFPPWVLGHHPDWEIIAASHTASLTLSFSRYIRDVMRDPGYNVVFPPAKLDPSSQSVENWNLTQGGGYLAAGVGTGITGRGCLAPYTCVDTPNGLQSIINIKVGDTVYGYRHESQKVVISKVVGIQVSKRAKRLLRHGEVVLTTDHRIFNAARGFYTHAGAEPNLLGLRREEGRARAYVQGVLFRPESEVNHRANLRQLWGSLHSSESRTPKVGGSPRRWGAKLLLSNLLRRVQSGASSFVQQGERFVRTVWEATRRVREEQVLQLRMLLKASFRESSAQGGLQRSVFGSEGESGSAGWLLPSMRGGSRGSLRSSPRGLRPGEQCDAKLGDSLYGVSPQISSVHGVSARQLAELLQEEDFVVDIQTETGNFFTEGLLVHNCHILLLDDLVKDIEAADSQTITDNTWEWYGSTAYTRLAPGGGVLGIMTWWSEQDWAGRIQETMKTGEGDVFEIVKYPAINDDGDEYILPNDHIEQFPSDREPPPNARLTRKQGTAVHPDRYDTEAMLRIKRNLFATGQKRVWYALYQQDPLPDEGILFTKEMLRYGNYQRRSDWRAYQAWDFSITEKRMSDWISCTTGYVTPEDDIVIADVLRFKVDEDGMSLVEAMIDQYVAHECSEIGFEDGQIWKSIKTLFEKRCRERKVYPSYKVLSPITDKVVRSGPLRGRMQMGKVFIQKNRPWNEAFIKELTHFPGGKHDDMVDSTAWMVRLAMEHTPRSQRKMPEPKSWKDKLRTLGRGNGVSHMAA